MAPRCERFASSAAGSASLRCFPIAASDERAECPGRSRAHDDSRRLEHTRSDRGVAFAAELAFEYRVQIEKLALAYALRVAFVGPEVAVTTGPSIGVGF